MAGKRGKNEEKKLKNLEKGARFSSTNQPANPGRKKKIYTILKETGYSGDDIKTAFGELAWYTLDELKELANAPDTPAIVSIVCKALTEAQKDGRYSLIKEILEYVLGKPNQALDITTGGESMRPRIVFRDGRKRK